MRILILNWRDIKNPAAGGAEVFTHENAKRFVKAGNKVTIFCSQYPKSKPEEHIDGVRIVRKGSRFSVYLAAYRFYIQNKDNFDVVVDETNTIPFFTPLYVKKPIFLLIHQLAREVWFYETRFPLSLIGFLLEPLYLRLYRNIPTITVSTSTKQNLLSLGFRDVSIVSEGIDFKPLSKVPNKPKNLTLLYVGRLKASKRVDHVIKAFKLVKEKIPDAVLNIVGEGDEMPYLKTIAPEGVFFHGYLDQKAKRRFMSQAHAILVTSVREGWGLIVIEANACGTPAIVYNVLGLRDSVKDGITGCITKDNSPESINKSIINLFKSKAYKFASNALHNSKNYTWDNSAKQFLGVIHHG